MSQCKGFIHSTESFGTVDGPGVRLVVFFQGCPMRCLYCHNPDTWAEHGGTLMSTEEILSLYLRNRSFYQNGGITATGGEPLMQLGFLTALFTEAKALSIHTCLDTSGICYREDQADLYAALFSVTDLVLLDIKHSLPEGHRKLCKMPQKPVLRFAAALSKAGVPMIVRHVVVPGITDTKEEAEALGELLASFQNLKGLQLLPYHTMGIKKYEALGFPYPLGDLRPADQDDIKKVRAWVLSAYKKTKSADRT